MKILITGGAGFVGSHLADELLDHGHEVRVLDLLVPQVHPTSERPGYLADDVELVRGDIRDAEAVRRALKGVDVVYHLAAAVGVGQSMYQIQQYESTNEGGTAVLLEALARHPIDRLVVASSMSIYGEGLYESPQGKPVAGHERSLVQLKSHLWELYGDDGELLTPVPTPEWKMPALPSVYAISKYAQERLCLVAGRAYGVPTVALRFFNIYGTRQALSNPYTGVLAIFASRYLNGMSPLINEDGRQRRDFIHVRDVVRACRLAMERPGAAGHAMNIGSGFSYSVAEIADRLGEVLNCREIRPEVTSRYRMGDIRHCFADVSLVRDLLDFSPRISINEGLKELAEWLAGQTAVDRVEQAQEELAARGLTV